MSKQDLNQSFRDLLQFTSPTKSQSHQSKNVSPIRASGAIKKEDTLIKSSEKQLRTNTSETKPKDFQFKQSVQNPPLARDPVYFGLFSPDNSSSSAHSSATDNSIPYRQVTQSRYEPIISTPPQKQNLMKNNSPAVKSFADEKPDLEKIVAEMKEKDEKIKRLERDKHLMEEDLVYIKLKTEKSPKENLDKVEVQYRNEIAAIKKNCEERVQGLKKIQEIENQELIKSFEEKISQLAKEKEELSNTILRKDEYAKQCLENQIKAENFNYHQSLVYKQEIESLQHQLQRALATDSELTLQNKLQDAYDEIARITKENIKLHEYTKQNDQVFNESIAKYKNLVLDFESQLKSERTEHQYELNELETRNQVNEKRVVSLQNELVEKNGEIKQLNEIISTLEKKFNKTSESYKKQLEEKHMAELSKQKEHYLEKLTASEKKSFEAYKKRIDKLEEENALLLEHNEKFKNALEESHETFRMKEEAYLNQFNQQKDFFEEQLQLIKEEAGRSLKNVEIELEFKDHEIQILYQEMNKLKTITESKNEDAASNASEQRKNEEEFEEKLDELRRNHIEELFNKEEKIRQLEIEIREERQDKISMEESLTKRIEQLETDFKDKMALLETKFFTEQSETPPSQLEEQLAELKESLEKKNKEIEDLVTIINDFKGNEAKLIEEKEHLEDSVKELKDIINKLESELQESSKKEEFLNEIVSMHEENLSKSRKESGFSSLPKKVENFRSGGSNLYETGDYFSTIQEEAVPRSPTLSPRARPSYTENNIPTPPKKNLRIETSFETVPKQEIITSGPFDSKDLSYQQTQRDELYSRFETGYQMREIVGLDENIIEQEFETLNTLDINRDVAKLSFQLNRFSEIKPYDYNIVRLEESNSTNGVINASYISTSYKGDRSLLVTQGPLENTIDDFWAMCYSSNVKLIVMLCKFQTEERELSCEYFPSNKSEAIILAHYEIKMIEIITLDFDLIERVFELRSLDDPDIVRVITHIQWVGWPDYGVPDSNLSAGIYVILRLMLDAQNSEQKNVVVQCSSGGGRSGTVVAIYNLCQQILYFAGKSGKDAGYLKEKLSVFRTVRVLREQRCSIVQTKEQYRLIYHVVSEVIGNLNLIRSEN